MKKILIFCLFFVLANNSNVNAVASYKAIPLELISQKNTQDENQVSFEYKVFDKKDCKKYLGRDKIIRKGYQPIQISIINNSDNDLEFSTSNFSFPCASCEEVIEKVNFKVTNRVVGYTIGALFIWPLLIPAIMEGVEGPKACSQLETDFYRKSLTTQVIKPHSTINGIIFVSTKQFKKEFSFELINQKNKDKIKLSTTTKNVQRRDKNNSNIDSSTLILK